MSEAVALVAVSVVRLDGKRLQPGTPFCASEAAAGELRGLGAARDATAEEAAAAKVAEIPLADLPPLDPARIRAIAGVVGMKLADAEWTQAGTPKVAALGALLPFVPTAEEAARFKRGA